MDLLEKLQTPLGQNQGEIKMILMNSIANDYTSESIPLGASSTGSRDIAGYSSMCEPWSSGTLDNIMCGQPFLHGMARLINGFVVSLSGYHTVTTLSSS